MRGEMICGEAWTNVARAGVSRRVVEVNFSAVREREALMTSEQTLTAEGIQPPEDARPPEEFLELFRDSGLSWPPMPVALAAELLPAGEALFSTAPWRREGLSPGLTFGMLLRPGDEGAAPLSEELPLERHLACGFIGHGIQSWRYRYLLLSPRCSLGVDLPIGTVLSDCEQKARDADMANDLLRLCLTAFGGDQAPDDRPVGLRLLINEFGLRYRLMDRSGLLAESDDLPKLLDVIDARFRALGGGEAPADQWLKI
jgi:hypothetical protein